MVDINKNNYASDLGEVIERPWGTYQSLYEDIKGDDDNYKVKRITINSGQMLSLQSHKYRSEHWTVVRGTGIVTLNDKEIILNVNESVYLEQGCIHRMANKGAETLIFIEVQCGTYLGEDDIKRYEDIYGRV